MFGSFRLSIRSQVVLLSVSALLAVTIASVILGTRLLREDRQAYLMEMQLSRVVFAVEKADARILRQAYSVLESYRQAGRGGSQAVGGYWLIRAGQRARWVGSKASGERPRGEPPSSDRRFPTQGQGLDALVADTDRIQKNPLRVPIALSPENGVTLEFIVALPDLEHESLSLHSLSDLKGSEVFGTTLPPVAREWLGSLEGSRLQSGIREVTDPGGTQWLVSYSRFSASGLLAVAAVDKATAFESVGTLQLRLALLGVGLFIAVLALSVFTSRSLVDRLLAVWSGTRRMTSGEVSARIGMTSQDSRAWALNDEVTELAESFNQMADRIVELLKEQEVKGRMQKELETAQLVQREFLPSLTAMHGSLSIAGRSIAADECGGDWWGRHQIREFTIIGIGDVTGHGVHSALVMAAAHGAFNAIMRELEGRPEVSPDPSWILERMNASLYQNLRAETGITFQCSVIDLTKGVLRTANAAHRPGMILNCGDIVQKGSAMSALRLIVQGVGKELGAGPQITFTTSEQAILPGDYVLWYTDGLLECEDERGRHWSKRELVQNFADIIQSGDSCRERVSAERLAGELIARNLEALGEQKNLRMDDITIVVAHLPEDAVESLSPQV
jgi:serine phosphatase RsbU (regulator of sigma subunit)